MEKSSRVRCPADSAGLGAKPIGLFLESSRVRCPADLAGFRELRESRIKTQPVKVSYKDLASFSKRSVFKHLKCPEDRIENRPGLDPSWPFA